MSYMDQTAFAPSGGIQELNAGEIEMVEGAGVIKWIIAGAKKLSQNKTARKLAAAAGIIDNADLCGDTEQACDNN
jgi:hypothetical protein